MVTTEVDLGARLLVYGGLLVAVPLSFLVLFRLIDYLALDDYVEQYRAATPDADHAFDAAPTTVDDAHICPHCGEHNDREFTFCRSCAARIAA